MLLVWLWFVSPSFSAEPALPPEAAAVWAQLDQVQRLTARFEQVQHRSVLSQPLRSTGTLAFARPNSVRWEVDSPTRSVFVVNGTTVGTAFPDLGHRETLDLAASPEAARFVQGLMVWLGGDLAQVQRDYTVEWRPGPPRTVILTPREPTLVRLLKSITLTVEGEPARIQKVVLVEPSGDRVEITLSAIVTDPTLPAATFTLP